MADGAAVLGRLNLGWLAKGQALGWCRRLAWADCQRKKPCQSAFESVGVLAHSG